MRLDLTQYRSRLYTVCTALALAAAGCGPVEAENNGRTNNGTANNEPANANCEPSMPSNCEAIASNGELVELRDAGELQAPCYEVDGNLELEEGELAVASGTSLYFSEDSSLDFRDTASLVAQGTEEEPVCFLGAEAERGFWRGIRVGGDTQTTLEHVAVEHAGSEAWGIRTERHHHGGLIVGSNATLNLTNSSFRNNDVVALRVTGMKEPTVTIASTTFEENARALDLPVTVAGGLAEDLAFENNDEEVVLVRRSLGDQTITTDVTLGTLDIPYRVEGTITLEAGSLNLGSGASLLFADDVGIEVEGEAALVAVGTEEEPVTLSGDEAERGFWRGVRVTSTAENRLENVVLEHAGSSPWTVRREERNQGGIAVVGSETTLAIANATFRQNAHAGIMSVDSPATQLAVIESTFEENERPIVLEAAQAEHLADLEVTGNDVDAVFLASSTPEQLVAGDATVWPALAAPYRVENTVSVESELTIEPGATVEFSDEAGLEVDGGSLQAIGTEEEPISFQGVEAEAGSWRGIYFTGTMSNDLGHVEVRDGGNYQWHNGRDASQGNIVLASSGSGTCGGEAFVNMRDALVANSGLHGVAVRHGSMVSGCENVEFEDNVGHDFLDAEVMANDPDYSEAGGCFCRTGCDCEE